MPSGTGMDTLLETFPDRFWDVAIAEQHAVTSMAAMAKEGFKPFCAIYSTFLQRAYDQVIHDVCLMDLPVAFAIDRAGIVGEDGETHQGAFDLSFLRAIPNMTLFAPRDETTLIDAVSFAADFPAPCAFRYPRGTFLGKEIFDTPRFELGKAQILNDVKSDMLFIGYGNGVGRALETIELLNKEVALLDLRFLKPLDESLLKELAKKHPKWYVFSDSAQMGGVGSALSELCAKENLDVTLQTFEYSDAFITHGNTQLVEDDLGITPEQIAKKI